MLLKAEDMGFRYGDKTRWILRHIDLTLEQGERIALVGPSGYGKSTLAGVLAGYLRPTEGTVLLDERPLPKKGYLPVQMIHQHPEQALNPRLKLEKSLNEAWTPDDRFLERMGIEKEWLKRWPTELSGGELQRFCIARVLGPETKFLICDEISTMLDVITQAQIWELILREADERGLGLLVVTHNMALAKRVCDKTIFLPDINKV